MKKKTTTAYKGFFKDLTCGNRMQYEVGKTFSVEPPIHKCAHGLHACMHPIDTISYYSPKTSRYAKVTLSGDMDMETAEDKFYQYTCSVDSKVAAQKLTVNKELSLSELVEAQYNLDLQNLPMLIEPARCYPTYKDYTRSAYLLRCHNEVAIIAVENNATVLSAGRSGNDYTRACVTLGDSSLVSSSRGTGVALACGSWSMARVAEYNSIAIANGNSSIAEAAEGSYRSMAIATRVGSAAICNSRRSLAYALDSKLELHAPGCIGVLHAGIAVVDAPDCVVFISMDHDTSDISVRACKGTVLIIQSNPAYYKCTSEEIYYHTVVVGKDIKPDKDGVITGKQLLAYVNFRRHKSLNRG